MQIGDDLRSLLETTDRSPEQTALEIIVEELYRQSRISNGKAAELLDMPGVQFIQRASELGVAVL